jgi:hypothetical protein
MRIILKHAVLFNLLACLTILACNQNQQDTKSENVFYNETTGWEIQLPNGWTTISKEENSAEKQIGKKALEEVFDGDINPDYDVLLSIKNSKNASLTATLEKFEEAYEGEWNDNNVFLKELMYKAFSHQNILIDTTSSVDTIDNIPFSVFNISIYARNKTLILNQILYATLINGFDFGVTVNYVEREDKEALMNALRSSKFNRAWQ